MAADVMVCRAAIARCTKALRAQPDDPAVTAALEDARRAYAVAQIEEYVARTVAKAPPLTDEQRRRLAGLLAAS